MEPRFSEAAAKGAAVICHFFPTAEKSNQKKPRLAPFVGIISQLFWGTLGKPLRCAPFLRPAILCKREFCLGKQLKFSRPSTGVPLGQMLLGRRQDA